jgi:hypothetical protein
MGRRAFPAPIRALLATIITIAAASMAWDHRQETPTVATSCSLVCHAATPSLLLPFSSTTHSISSVDRFSLPHKSTSQPPCWFHTETGCPSDGGKLGEYSDKNERGGPQCPNIHPSFSWVNIRTDFQGLAFFREAGHFSRESCNTGFHLL